MKYLNMLINQITNGITKVSILGLLPIIPVSVVLLSTILLRINYKGKSPSMEEMKLQKSNNKSVNIYYGIDIGTTFITTISIVFSFLPFLLFENVKHQIYIDSMISKIETLSTITIGLTTIIITISVVLILFDKNYYLIFSIKEVLKTYHFFYFLAVILISCIITCIFTMSLLNQEVSTYFDFIRLIILEIAVIFNIGCSSIAFIIVFRIMFSEEKNELKMLSKLYRIFFIHNLDVTQIKGADKWNVSAMKINVEYLTERYLKICEKNKVELFNKLEFVTTIGIYKDKWYKKARNKFIILLFALYTISVLINLYTLKDESKGLIVLNTIFVGVAICLSFFKIQSFQLALFKLFSDIWGYYIKKVNKKGRSKEKDEEFIPRVAIRFLNKSDQYIQDLNSLVAFFYIALLKEVDNKEIVHSIEVVLEWFQEYKGKNAIFYLPIFTIGYFAFERKYEINIIKNEYKLLDLDETGRHCFKLMMYSQIFNLKRYVNIKQLEAEKKMTLYLKWLCTY